MKFVMATMVLGICLVALGCSLRDGDRGGVLGFLAASCGYAALALEIAA